MDIKDSYLHGTVGVVKSISVDADKLKYTLADIAGTVREVTLPLATTSANGLMSSGDKTKLDNLSSTIGNYVTLNTDQEITGTKTFTKQLKFTVAKGTAPFLVTSDTKVDNLNADLLDGYHRTDIIQHHYANENTSIDLNNLLSGTAIVTGHWAYAGSANVSNLPWDYSAANIWTLPGLYNLQIAKFYNSNDIRVRGYRSSGWTSWQQLAFTDSDITGNAASADKLKNKVKLWGLDFDGTADVSGNMTGVGSINNVFTVSTDGNGVAHLKIREVATTLLNYIHLYVTSNTSDATNTRPLIIQKDYGNVGIGLTNPSEKLHVSGNVKATSFQGNLDGSYVHKLTGYAKSTTASDLSTDDTLNTALGKLEYKADTAYDWIISVTAEDTDKYVNKWLEILDFLDLVEEGKDITDEFVTRKTDLTITGIKTFQINPSASSATIKNGEIRINANTYGGWTRGMILSNTDTNASGETTTVSATIGVFGGGYGSQHTGNNRIEYLFMSHLGLEYHNAVFKVYSNKATISGNEIYHKGNLKNLSDLNDDVVSGKYLPLSGGTLTGELRINSGNLLVTNGHTVTGWLYPKTEKETNLGLEGRRWKTIFGVDGNFTGLITSNAVQGTAPFVISSNTKVNNLNADLLDGNHLIDFLHIEENPASFDLNTGSYYKITAISWNYANMPNITNLPWEGTAGTVISFPGTKGFLLYKPYESNTLWFRDRYLNTYYSWKQIAFTDSDITGNAASVGDASMKLYPQNSNEINFGGSNRSDTIYFGYRPIDSKPIPKKFVFGETGTAEIVVNKVTSNLGNFSDLLIASKGIQLGNTQDIGWFIAGTDRICAGYSTARGVNVKNLLISNVWADSGKVPEHGIYAKGNIVTDGTGVLGGLKINKHIQLSSGPGFEIYYNTNNNSGVLNTYDRTLNTYGDMIFGANKFEFRQGSVYIGYTTSTEKLNVAGNIVANKFIVSGGTAAQFLKADGSVDNNTYAKGQSAKYACLGTPDDNKWIRIAKLTSYNSFGLITIHNGFNNNATTGVTFLYNLGYRDSTQSTINLIGGINNVFSKARIVQSANPDSNYEAYIEVTYLPNVDYSNTVWVNVANCIHTHLYTNKTVGSVGEGESVLCTCVFKRGLFSSLGYYKYNSSDSYVLLGGGGHKAVSDFALSSDLSNYVTLDTELTITGKKCIYTNSTDKWYIGGSPYKLEVTRSGEWASSLIVTKYKYDTYDLTSLLGIHGRLGSIENWFIALPGQTYNDAVFKVYKDNTIVRGYGQFWGNLRVGKSTTAISDAGSLNKALLQIGNFNDKNIDTFSYGTAIWTEGSGKGCIQQGRGDGTVATYSLCLQPLGGKVGIGTITPEYKLDVMGSLGSDTITLKNDTSNPSIIFSRSGHNYIKAPTDGTISFTLSNNSKIAAESSLHINRYIILPGTTNVISLGTSDCRWSNVYSVLGNFTGDVTLYNSTGGDSPHLYFLRGTTSDSTYDWDMFVTGGTFTLRQHKSGTWNTALTAIDNSMSTDWRFHVGKELSVKDQRFNYGLAYYNDNSGTVTGTIVITLPNGWTSSMNTYELDIYEYQANDGDTDNVLYSKLIIDGYNYADNPKWYNLGYTQIGSYNKGVRLGYNGSKCVIMLGTTTTKWTYPQVHLSRVITGRYSATSWSSGYSINVVTDESGYSDIVTARRLKQIFATVEATKFVTSGGISSQFVKGDGSLDSTTYISTSSLETSLPDRLKAIITLQNCDTITNTGFYYTNTGTLPSNVKDGHLIQTQTSGGFIHQILMRSGGPGYSGSPYDGADIYHRLYNGNTQTVTDWNVLLSSLNYHKFALPLTGGVMTGVLEIYDTTGNNNYIRYRATRIGSGGHADSIIAILDSNDVTHGSFGIFGNETLLYIYIGHDVYNGLNLRIYKDSVTFGWNTILHAGNYKLYALSLKGGTLSANNRNLLILHDANTSSSHRGSYIKFTAEGSSTYSFVGLNTSSGAFFEHCNGYANHILGITNEGKLTFNKLEVWHEGNDGPGSGLDSDLLDGKQGSWYVNTGSSLGENNATSGWRKVGEIVFNSTDTKDLKTVFLVSGYFEHTTGILELLYRQNSRTTEFSTERTMLRWVSYSDSTVLTNVCAGVKITSTSLTIISLYAHTPGWNTLRFTILDDGAWRHRLDRWVMYNANNAAPLYTQIPSDEVVLNALDASISNKANKLSSTAIVTDKAFNLVNTQWIDITDASNKVYKFTNLESGTYAIQVTSGTDLVASGIMSVYKNLEDSAGDEIPLHVYSNAGWRPYLRTFANKLLISSNDVSSKPRTVTIKIALIL